MNRYVKTKKIRYVILLLIMIAVGQSCSSDGGSGTSPNSAQPPIDRPETAVAEQPPAEVDPTILDRLRTEKWTGDINGMVERRYIRALVLYNKTSFFYDGPQPRGISYEGLKEFEKFLNQKLNTGSKPLQMVFIPVTRDEGLKRMADGRADIAVANIPIITSNRSEEHTSELQSLRHLVCRLLLEKKKKRNNHRR